MSVKCRPTNIYNIAVSVSSTERADVTISQMSLRFFELASLTLS